MTLIELAKKLRPLIEKAAISLDDSDALEAKELFPQWSGETIKYPVDYRVRYNNVLYRVLQEHTSQPNWNPEDAPSLYAKVLIPDPTVIPNWEQPDSTNPYQIGDRVSHNGTIWENVIANNVWEPGVYGWVQVDENAT